MIDGIKAIRRLLLWVLLFVICDLVRIAEYALMGTSGIADIIYLPLISLIFLEYVNTRVAAQGGQRYCILGNAVMIVLFVVIRELKYGYPRIPTIFPRYLWYLYYVPILMIPTLLLFSVQLMDREFNRYHKHLFWTVGSITVILVCLVLTNDFHQAVFSFDAGFDAWAQSYSYGICYVFMMVWEYGLYLGTMITMVLKSRLKIQRGLWWIPTLSMVLQAVLLIVSSCGVEFRSLGKLILGVPEIIILSTIIFWEACTSVGLIPTNEGYGDLLRRLNIPVWLVSKNGTVVFFSEIAGEFPKEILGRSGTLQVRENYVLHSEPIVGGFGVWEEDQSELNRTIASLQEQSERLREESELLRMENRTKEEEERYRQRNTLYDRITGEITPKLKQIDSLSTELKRELPAQRKRYVATMICFYGAYIKRISNLMLLQADQTLIQSGELILSIQEGFRYLRPLSVPCEIQGDMDVLLDAEKLIGLYRVSQQLVEDYFPFAAAVMFAYRSDNPYQIRITIEGCCRNPCAESMKKAAQCGVTIGVNMEEPNTFLRIAMERGGVSG